MHFCGMCAICQMFQAVLDEKMGGEEGWGRKERSGGREEGGRGVLMLCRTCPILVL